MAHIEHFLLRITYNELSAKRRTTHKNLNQMKKKAKLKKKTTENEKEITHKRMNPHTNRSECCFNFAVCDYIDVEKLHKSLLSYFEFEHKKNIEDQRLSLSTRTSTVAVPIRYMASLQTLNDD